MNDQFEKRILLKYFEGKATPHEKQQLAEWLKQEGNDEIFYHQWAIWESANLQFQADTAGALQKFERVLDATGKPVQINRTNTRLSQSWINPRVAAVAATIVLLLAALFYTNSDFIFYQVYTTEFGMTKNIILEDGSEVTLSANSRLKVPRSFQGDRQVWLKGEAFFAVAKTENKDRFMVKTDHVTVEVLGTKFNVNNRHQSTEVVLNEGSIRLTSNLSDANAPLLMQPGDYASLSQQNEVFVTKSVKPADYAAWQNGLLIFDETSLEEVAQKIEDFYGIEVVIDNDLLAKRAITGAVPNNDLGIVLKALSSSMQLTIERENNKVTFKNQP
jgi:transmembrane sensor